jgi:hypothetical protein
MPKPIASATTKAISVSRGRWARDGKKKFNTFAEL